MILQTGNTFIAERYVGGLPFFIALFEILSLTFN